MPPSQTLNHILQTFTEEDDSAEMLQAVKWVHQSPILGQVLLQMYLRLKESENDKAKAQLAEQEQITHSHLQEIKLKQMQQEILKL